VRVLSVLLILLALAPKVSPASPPAFLVEDLVRKFDSYYWSGLNESYRGVQGKGLIGSDNTAILLNNDNHVMEALLNLYEITRDVKYLRWAEGHLDDALAVRDDIRGFYNWQGRSEPVWSNGYDAYLALGHQDKQHAFMVENGAMISALSRFALLVLVGDASVMASFGSKAEIYLKRSEETLDYYRRHFQIFSGTRPYGWFVEPAHAYVALGLSPDKVPPLNFLASLGNAAHLIYKVQKLRGVPESNSTRDLTVRMCNLFDNELESAGHGLVNWYYWPVMRGLPHRPQRGHDNATDIGHGYLDVRFMVNCHEAFPETIPRQTIDRLARTIAEKVFVKVAQPNGIFNLVDGTSPFKRFQGLRYAGQFYEIFKYSPSLRETCITAFLTVGRHDQSLDGIGGTGSALSLESFSLILKQLALSKRKASGIHFWLELPLPIPHCHAQSQFRISTWSCRVTIASPSLVNSRRRKPLLPPAKIDSPFCRNSPLRLYTSVSAAA